jgi:branched-chain amino acid transport system ATP-binding protein
MRREILHIDHLSKSFDGLRLFNDVTVALHDGTINGLFGKNGSGKTTLFNMIGGYEKPDSGTILFCGTPIRYGKQFLAAKSGIGRMWQDPLIFPNHTVLQNLLICDNTNPGELFLNNVFRPRTVREKEQELKERALGILEGIKLASQAGQPAGNLSTGERKLIGISMLLMNEAKLLLLDEPFSAIDGRTIDRISEILIGLKQSGKTIFMIEHKLKHAEPISDQIFRIRDYRIEV